MAVAAGIQSRIDSPVKEASVDSLERPSALRAVRHWLHYGALYNLVTSGAHASPARQTLSYIVDECRRALKRVRCNTSYQTQHYAVIITLACSSKHCWC